MTVQTQDVETAVNKTSQTTSFVAGGFWEAAQKEERELLLHLLLTPRSLRILLVCFSIAEVTVHRKVAYCPLLDILEKCVIIFILLHPLSFHFSI